MNWVSFERSLCIVWLNIFFDSMVYVSIIFSFWLLNAPSINRSAKGMRMKKMALKKEIKRKSRYASGN